jgi:hypothetical protein
MSAVDFGEILKGGYATWKNNLSICVPFILSMVISLVVLMMVALIAFFSLFYPLLQTYLTNPSTADLTELFSQVAAAISGNLVSIILLLVAIIIIISLVSSFFISGAIGMVKEAILTGSTNISHMIDYGKKKYLSYFGANLIVGLIISFSILSFISSSINDAGA